MDITYFRLCFLFTKDIGDLAELHEGDGKWQSNLAIMLIGILHSFTTLGFLLVCTKNETFRNWFWDDGVGIIIFICLLLFHSIYFGVNQERIIRKYVYYHDHTLNTITIFYISMFLFLGFLFWVMFLSLGIRKVA